MSEAVLVKIDATDFRKVELRLGGAYKKAPSAVSRALNRAAESTRTEAVRETTKRYHVKAEEIRGSKKKEIPSKLWISKASANRLTAIINSSSSRIPLDHFKTSSLKFNNRSPIMVAVKKDGLKKLSHAFIFENKYPGGGNARLIFQRVGKERLPIKRLYGPSISELVGGRVIRPEVEKTAAETYNKRITHEIERALEATK
jgi:hypothetical protein